MLFISQPLKPSERGSLLTLQRGCGRYPGAVYPQQRAPTARYRSDRRMHLGRMCSETCSAFLRWRDPYAPRSSAHNNSSTSDGALHHELSEAISPKKVSYESTVLISLLGFRLGKVIAHDTAVDRPTARQMSQGDVQLRAIGTMKVNAGLRFATVCGSQQPSANADPEARLPRHHYLSTQKPE